MAVPELIYADGGVIGRNPSARGGTWCYVWVTNGEVVKMGSGVITPDELGVEKITNNQTELYAVLRALQSAPQNWAGTICTDSQVTVFRFTTSLKFNGIPHALGLRVRELRKFRAWSIRLVAGHPTEKELTAGVRARNGLPTSIFNVMCDEECNRLAKVFLNQRRQP